MSGGINSDGYVMQPPWRGGKKLLLTIHVYMRSAGRQFAVISVKMLESAQARSNSRTDPEFENHGIFHFQKL